MAGSVAAVTDVTFEAEVLKHDKPVLVDFWATWCGPCKMLSPILDELAGERDDVTFVKINADENPNVGRDYGVMGLPTLLLFRDGNLIDSFVGARPKGKLVAELEKALQRG